MPVDSVHAVIEKYISKMNIQAPSECPTIIRNARRRPKPYEVIPVHFGEFLNWKGLTYTVPKRLKTSEEKEIKISEVTRAKFSKKNLNRGGRTGQSPGASLLQGPSATTQANFKKI